MTDYDILPIDSQLAGVRLYGDSLQPIRRGQPHNAERHAVIQGSAPQSDSDGLEPGETQIAGTWLGADASALADRLRAIFDDPGVTRVEIDSVGTTTELDGEYRLGGNQTLERIADSDAAWRYQLILIED